MRSVRSTGWFGIAFAVIVAACGSESDERPRPPVEGGDTTPDLPVVGGACSYEPMAFRATVDSVLGDGTLLVRPDTVPAGAGRCHLLRDMGMGRWRVPQPGGAGVANPGDTVEITGEVIVMGTCTPCGANTTVIVH